MLPAYLLYTVGMLLAISPWASSAVALLLGITLSLGVGVPLPSPYKKVAKILLQVSIVALGFAMDPTAVMRAGAHGVGITALGLGFTLLLGYVLAKQLKIPHVIASLITVGTAICGGSAIAAVGPAMNADSDEMAVSLAVVFLLNAIALVVFPPLGHAFGLSPATFGLFSAIAIHDTSSVVGAAAAFSELSVPVAVTVKLTRALWILPMSFAAAYYYRANRKGGAAVPWFIAFFVAAVAFRAIFPDLGAFYSTMNEVGRAGLKGAIFLISAQMTRAALKRVGARPLIFAVCLWGAVISGTLVLLRAGVLTPP